MEHYFTNNPDLKSEIREIPYIINNCSFKFLSDNGVFSKNKIDYASSFLVNEFLENHGNLEGKTVLDVGCGYGFLGIIINKFTKAHVEMIDINKRALHLCERNIKLNNVNCIAYLSDFYENIKISS